MKLLGSALVNRAGSQPLFEALHSYSLAALNYGRGNDLKNSGEISVIKYLSRRLSGESSPVVFDVGAHIGSYALEIITILGKQTRLYCFEPANNNFKMLVSNLGDHENTTVYNFGLGDKEEVVPFYSEENAPWLSSMFDRQLDHFGISLKRTEDIVVRRLDDFCKENGVGHIDLLKLDVEGNELNVLKGACDMINSRSIDFIQFEFGGSNIDSRTYFRDFFYLLDPRYRIYRVLRDGLALIDQYNEVYEIFLTTNYLAVARDNSLKSS